MILLKNIKRSFKKSQQANAKKTEGKKNEKLKILLI